MKGLIQELKTISYGGGQGPLPGYVAQIWVPTKHGTKFERMAKDEDWWMYGRRRAGKGLAYYIRIEHSGLKKRVEYELARLDPPGEWRGKAGSKERRVAGARRISPPSAAA